MVRRAVKVAIQTALFLHVLQSSVSGTAGTTTNNNNFDSMNLVDHDRSVAVSPAKISDAVDEDTASQEERMFGIGQSPPSDSDTSEAMNAPTFARPPTPEFIKQHKDYLSSMIGSPVPSDDSSAKGATPTLNEGSNADGGISNEAVDEFDNVLKGLGKGGAAGGAGAGGSGGMESLLAGLGSGGSGMGNMLAGLGGSGSGPGMAEMQKLLGGNLGGLGGGLGMFSDPSIPQNNTVEDTDFILGELYGGKEHGIAFSDINNVRFGQTFLNITIRGAERLDQIGLLVLSEETVGRLYHGGEGGGSAYLEPEMGETIDAVDVHWDKNDGKTCIFYLQFTMSSGKTLAAGTKTANFAKIEPPKEYKIAGFHGRSNKNGIFCIGAIFTKVGAVDLKVTDVMAVSKKGSPDIYNYKTTIRNWVGHLERSENYACYQKRVDVSTKDMCPSGYRKDGDRCITQCPLTFPVSCLTQCIPQNSDCTQAVIAKVVSVLAVALNVATVGVFGAMVSAYRVANFVLACAISVVNAIRSLLFYLRYTQVTIPQNEIEKLMDKAFQMQIVLLDLPMAICACLGLRIPPKLFFSVTVIGVVSTLVMMAIMIGEKIFSSEKNVLSMLRESGAMNTTALSRKSSELGDFLNKKNSTCGHEMKTLTNRVIGKVQEIRRKTPGADREDVRVAVSKSPIISEDIPTITNHCMGEIWANQTGKAAFKTRTTLRKTLGVIIEQLIEDGTTDMGVQVVKKEKALQYATMGLFILSMLDPSGIAWMAMEFVQPICGPTEYLGEIDDGTANEALGLSTVDQAFAGSYGIWKKKGDGSVKVYFESVDKYDVDVVLYSGGEKINEVKVPAGGKTTWTATVEELQDKTFYMDRWRPGLFGLPGSGGGSLLMWISRSSEGGQLILHARLNVS